MKDRNQIITFLGIFLLLFGIASGISLLQKDIMFRLRASPKVEISQVWVTNIKDSSATIIWKAMSPSSGFVKWNEHNSAFQRIAIPSSNNPEAISSVELRELNHSTIYEFSIVINGFESTSKIQFQTAQKRKEQTKSYFINGKVLSKDGSPVENALVLVHASGSSPLSTISGSDGAWSINIAEARTQSLSNYVIIEEQKTVLDINVYTENSHANIKTTPANAQNLNIFLDQAKDTSF